MAKRQTQLDIAIDKIGNDILDLEKEITILQHAQSRLMQHRADDEARPRREYTTKADQV